MASRLSLVKSRHRFVFCAAAAAMSFPSARHTSAFSTIPIPGKRAPYEPPKWTIDILENPPKSRLTLCNLPTPLYKIEPVALANSLPKSKSSTTSILQSLADHDIGLFIKRDDATGGVELGGNKLRKLDFLLADALDKGCNSVVTIGGEQSNHCRATASASRMLGLDPHLILRTKRANKVQDGEDEFGCVGNVLIDRMIGSKIYTCTPGEYGRIGSDALVERVCAHLDSTSTEENPVKAYGIPVGGSNAVGTWGYINGVEEMLDQWGAMKSDSGSTCSLDHVVFACGSGGTAAGITLGLALARSSKPNIHAIGVCDDPDYFYNHVAKIADDMGLVLPSYLSTVDWIKEKMTAHQGKGLGYASSTPEELDFVARFAQETGIVLDPVYSGKALYHFINHVLEEDIESFRGKNILFWHTGGALGLYEKTSSLTQTLESISPVKRLDVYGKNSEGDGSVSI